MGLDAGRSLRHLGFEVTVVEMLDQVMAPLDPEYARLVGGHMEMHGVELTLGDEIRSPRRPMTRSRSRRSRARFAPTW